MTTIELAASDHAAAWVRRLRAIPDRLRRYEVTDYDAHRMYGIRADLLEALRSAGLPCGGGAEGRLWDAFDLTNLSLHLRCSSIQRMAMRSWAASLRLAAHVGTLTAHLEFIPETLDGPRDHPCDFSLLLPGEGRVTVTAVPGAVVRRMALKRRTVWPSLPESARTLVRRIAELDFCMVPEALRWNMDFIRDTATTECGGASKLLCALAREAGFSARHQFGLLLAKPFSTPHFWSELNIDGEWVPVDPLLLKILHQSTGLDPRDWPSERSPGGAFLPLAEVIGYEPILGRPILRYSEDWPALRNPIGLLDGKEIPVSIPTDFSTGAAGESP